MLFTPPLVRLYFITPLIKEVLHKMIAAGRRTGYRPTP